MGYDISVRFNSHEERAQMLEFLSENKSLLEQLRKTEPLATNHDKEPYLGEDLSYAPKKDFLLGFHGTGIPYYIWAICSWMSVQSTFRKGDKAVVYYDTEVINISIAGSLARGIPVDENGITQDRLSPKRNLVNKITHLFPDYDKQRKILNEIHTKWLDFSKKDTPSNGVEEINEVISSENSININNENSVKKFKM